MTPSLWERMSPTMKRLLKSYLLVLAAALVLVGILFLVNLFFPFGGDEFVGRAVGTFFTLILGWGWGILGAFMMSYRPLRAAGACGLAVGVSVIVFGSLAVWEFTEYDLWNIPAALFWVQVALAAGIVGWLMLDRKTFREAAIATIGITALAGLVLALHTLELVPTVESEYSWIEGRVLDDRYADSAFSLGAGFAVASTLLLLPPWREFRHARWVAYAAPAELGLMGLVHPWLQGGFQDRWAIAGWVVAAILILIAATIYIIAKLRPEPARA